MTEHSLFLVGSDTMNKNLDKGRMLKMSKRLVLAEKPSVGP